MNCLSQSYPNQKPAPKLFTPNPDHLTKQHLSQGTILQDSTPPSIQLPKNHPNNPKCRKPPETT